MESFSRTPSLELPVNLLVSSMVLIGSLMPSSLFSPCDCLYLSHILLIFSLLSSTELSDYLFLVKIAQLNTSINESSVFSWLVNKGSGICKIYQVYGNNKFFFFHSVLPKRYLKVEGVPEVLKFLFCDESGFLKLLRVVWFFECVVSPYW